MINFFGAIMRKKIIAGNWKMHGSLEFAKDYLEFLLPRVEHLALGSPSILLAVPYPLLSFMCSWSAGSVVEIGSQNIHQDISGAFTGEVSSSLVKELGASFTLIGHSERRQFFYETESLIRKKLDRALSTGLQPIFCIGENLEQRNQGQAECVVKNQLKDVLTGFSEAEAAQLVIAYEPVWAIGTGKSASADLAEEMHSICRNELNVLFGKKVGERIPILYGGSVKPENSGEFFCKENIDGALVGGASLSATSFLEIIQTL